MFRVLLALKLSLSLVILAASSECAHSQHPAKPTSEGQAQENEIQALIEKLQGVSDEDLTAVGGFLLLTSQERAGRLHTLPQPGTVQKQPGSDLSIMRELVKRGAAAVPHLIAHLDDARPTRITVRHEFIGLGGMLFDDHYDYNSRTRKHVPQGVNRSTLGEDHTNIHTVTVGDLCYVILGQIVNRSFYAVTDFPTNCIMVSSPTHSEQLRKVIKQEWGALTPEQHKETLKRDFLEPDDWSRRFEAAIRLGYFYRDDFESLALKRLAEPCYDGIEVQGFVWDKLYRAKDAAERKKLFDDFIAKRGELAKQGILLQLRTDLASQEVLERGRNPSPTHPGRACLMEFFGYPKDVKSDNLPKVLPLSYRAQGSFVETLRYFPSPKIDQTVLKMMQTTEARSLAASAATYLVGRGADAEIRSTVERLLKSSEQSQEDPYTEYDRRQLRKVLSRQGWTPLHVAAEIGDSERMSELLRNAVDVDARDVDGWTPLHVAINYRSYECGHLLLDRKANPNLKDKQGLTPLQWIVQQDEDDTDAMIKLLLRYGAEVSDVFVASRIGRADVVKSLLQEDRNRVSATNEGDTPLHLAARHGRTDVVDVLLSYGANVNAPNSIDWTPLHEAVNERHAQVVRILLAHKADRHALDSLFGQTPLDLARNRGNEEILRLLEDQP